jgi:hypothetical protein
MNKLSKSKPLPPGANSMNNEKPDVVSDNSEFAHANNIGKESDANAKPYPDSAWKTASQVAVEKFLPGFVGKVNK